MAAATKTPRAEGFKTNGNYFLESILTCFQAKAPSLLQQIQDHPPCPGSIHTDCCSPTSSRMVLTGISRLTTPPDYTHRLLVFPLMPPEYSSLFVDAGVTSGFFPSSPLSTQLRFGWPFLPCVFPVITPSAPGRYKSAPVRNRVREGFQRP